MRSAHSHVRELLAVALARCVGQVRCSFPARSIYSFRLLVLYDLCTETEDGAGVGGSERRKKNGGPNRCRSHLYLPLAGEHPAGHEARHWPRHRPALILGLTPGPQIYGQREGTNGRVRGGGEGTRLRDMQSATWLLERQRGNPFPFALGRRARERGGGMQNRAGVECILVGPRLDGTSENRWAIRGATSLRGRRRRSLRLPVSPISQGSADIESTCTRTSPCATHRKRKGGARV